jgi:hypothetical protein
VDLGDQGRKWNAARQVYESQDEELHLLSCENMDPINDIKII